MPLLQTYFAGRGLLSGYGVGELGIAGALTAHVRLASVLSSDTDASFAEFRAGTDTSIQRGAGGGPQHDETSGPTDVIPGNTSTTFVLTIGGSQSGRVNVAGDDDWFQVNLVAGQSYVFTLTGDIGSGTPLSDCYLELYNEFGSLIGIDDDAGPGADSLLRWTATQSGTYYINARAYEDPGNPTLTGNYTITAALGTPQNPLDTINEYFTAASHIDVYFATTGQTFGSGQSSATALRSWTQAEIDAVFAALATYSNVAPLTFSQTFNQASAEFTLVLTNLDPGVLGWFSAGIGLGAFSPSTSSWMAAGSLLPGGSAFTTLVHEFGHGLGLAHPHDNGAVNYGPDNSEIMQGVIDSFNSYGTFLMNQGVFTVMSYNDGWDLAPGGGHHALANTNEATPMALDVALIQARYGVNGTFHNGADTYTLTGVDGAWVCIWDTGGTDAISYAGAANATIDLRAATLQNEVGGGGFVSFVRQGVNPAVQQGFTIAAGVMIENANGGSGADTLIGNGVANVLNGGAGADAMTGGAGDDTYIVDNAGDTVTENASEGTDTVQASVNFTLSANVENLTLTGSAVSGIGNGLNNTIIGNAAGNALNGGAGADVMSGGAGGDTYTVDNAGDTVTENAGEGTDVVLASVSYTLGANVENLILTGGSAINGTGNGLDNVMVGNGVANVLNGGAGADAMTGGAGDDTYVVDNAGDTVSENASEGTDTVQASISYTLGSDVENLTLTGAALNGTGNGLNNSITGNANANTLDGAGGADAMAGGGGDDTYVVDNAGDTVGEGGGAGTDTVMASVTFSLSGNVENLTLTGVAAINGFGNILGNAITGNGAANQLNGFDGADTLDGGGGADAMFGGNGDDTYFVDNAADVTSEVSALGGTDTIMASVSYNLTANIENLTLTGAAATAAGNALNNLLIGNSGANTLYGFDGNDRLDGGAGADTLFGAAGDDVYVVDDAGDITVEGIAGAAGGVDTVESSISRNLNANFENLTLTGIAAATGYGNILNNVMTGNSAANSLYGFDGNDTLDGAGGVDQMFGGNGDDTYIVDNASDVTSETSPTGGIDTVMSSVTRNLTANLENLVLTGNAAITGAGNVLDNVITGNSAANTLFGLDGADTLDGGLGADTLQGGPGADTYVFSSALGAGNIDAIVNFSVVDDVIQLSTAVFTGIAAGVLDAAAFVIGAAAADGDDRIIYDSATGALYFDPDGDGAAAQIQFATLAAGLALTNDDFFGIAP